MEYIWFFVFFVPLALLYEGWRAGRRYDAHQRHIRVKPKHKRS